MMTDPNQNLSLSVSAHDPLLEGAESAQPLESVAVFCGNCSCGCPELFVDHAADEERRIVITDDFGQRVQMSLTQLSALVADVKSGVLDRLVA
jgi:hypothetical protein